MFEGKDIEAAKTEIQEQNELIKTLKISDQGKDLHIQNLTQKNEDLHPLAELSTQTSV